MRAPRFPLHLSVRYRRVGDRQWRRGETENISRSGVLIRGEDPLEIDATVELMVALAVRSAAAISGEVQCSGRALQFSSERCRICRIAVPIRARVIGIP